ncbi:hypothetical protein BV097_01362 [Haemophilus influenzae]|nr:hypothetical protein BV097_01362 [Haemophilus influenzae]PRJ57457.1 hypothetical protein BV094_00774 [Haemophilus influenzae]
MLPIYCLYIELINNPILNSLDILRFPMTLGTLCYIFQSYHAVMLGKMLYVLD